MNVLITGFGPFGEDEENPSGEIAGALHGTTIAGGSVRSVVLPVSSDRVAELLQAELAGGTPDVLLLLGVATGRAAPSVERVAVNVRDFPMPDNDGRQAVDEPVVAEGPAAYLSALPIKAIVAGWRAAGLPGYVSNTAGTYLCNQAFYLARHLTAGTGCRTGFIHVPASPASIAARGVTDTPIPTMDLTTTTSAIRSAVETTLCHRGADVDLAAGALD
ncbi:MAG TPA: pyroglutamyl-peptidase I [Solirubrobacteraceae bacterium]|nr:pyroglutamyl-peptidase I [Solirubrobacteraceae bacterium]